MLLKKLLSLVIITIISIALLSCTDNGTFPLKLDKGEPPPSGKLDRRIVPIHYTLDLTVDPGEPQFSGRVVIDIQLSDRVNQIWLHSVDIDMEKVQLKTQSGHSIYADHKQLDSTGVSKISFPKWIEPGKAKLIMEYRAPFNKSLEGLYKVEEDGLSYAFSQLEATSARFVFPGFDDPQFKTPFDVSLTIPEDQVGISNTREISNSTLPGGMKKITFLTTEPLPTYLLAFAIGPLDVVEWTDIPATALRDRAIPLRGIAVRGKGKRMDFALANTQKILTTLEDYFGVSYPYDKLDIIAAPDFAAGAMENAGAIVYREKLVFIDDATSNALKRSYFGVHAHELAHMWFGNLVTPKWWDDIWLNESFATWMSYKALSTAYPSDGYEGLMTDKSLKVMDEDSRISARQVRQEILSNHDIGNAFDRITYDKGGAILTMFESFIGEKAFREGIRTHMKNHAFGNADVYDLLSSLEQGSGNTDIAASFSSFILQPGTPQVDISDFKSGAAGTSMSVNISRYLPMGSRGSKNKQWNLPLCVVLAVDGQRVKRCQFIENSSTKLHFADIDADFVFPNAQGAGYYRFTMDAVAMSRLMDNYELLTVPEKKVLYNSTFAAFKSGNENVEGLMLVMEKLATDDAWDVANKPTKAFYEIIENIVPKNSKDTFLKRVQTIYSPTLAEIGLWPKETAENPEAVSTVLLRDNLIDFLALSAKHKKLRIDLDVMAKTFIGFSGDNKIHSELVNLDLIDTALIVAIEDNDKDFFNALLAQFKNSRDAAFRDIALKALYSTQDKKLANSLLAMVLDQSIRDNEASALFFGLSGNEIHSDKSWLWLQENIEAFVDRIPSWRRGRATRVADQWCSVDKINELNTFFNPIIDHMEGGPRLLAQAIENIELCDALKSRTKNQFPSFLNNYGG